MSLFLRAICFDCLGPTTLRILGRGAPCTVFVLSDNGTNSSFGLVILGTHDDPARLATGKFVLITVDGSKLENAFKAESVAEKQSPIKSSDIDIDRTIKLDLITVIRIKVT